MKPGKANAEVEHIRARYREIMAKRGIRVKTLREMNTARATNAKASRERRAAQ